MSLTRQLAGYVTRLSTYERGLKGSCLIFDFQCLVYGSFSCFLRKATAEARSWDFLLGFGGLLWTFYLAFYQLFTCFLSTFYCFLSTFSHLVFCSSFPFILLQTFYQLFTCFLSTFYQLLLGTCFLSTFDSTFSKNYLVSTISFYTCPSFPFNF